MLPICDSGLSPASPDPADPLSSAEGIMGKVRQFSRISHLWAILSQGLFFKGAPDRLERGSDVGVDVNPVAHFSD